ncbi:methyltransferase domain-containing protein [Sphingobium sp. HWE2-09]|uniref:methyltransferase domain-containing protein n=1 Tax=Sphingobium sp. HWE2-09 TaxID=3108390 RepID=UPI002DD2757C|nr:methyltransferase domain-containing protein [Sphingobium sp. HWE2-09]
MLPSVDAKYIRGIGLSDSISLANRLSQSFDYTNTFYHTDPMLDICNPSDSWINQHDFLISSDVFEHVPSPVQRAFDGAFSVLRPGGLFVLTVPFDDRQNTTEHFPNVRDFKLIDFDGEWLLAGRTAEGDYELHNDLIFHGGPGTTVELRFFSRDDLIGHLEAAGFTAIEVHDCEIHEYGIFHPHYQGVPITAWKPQ